MKTILKYLMLIAVTGFVTVSCEYDETNFDSLTKDLDANANYYVQFVNASKSLETGVSESGGLVEIETTIDVVLLGSPRSEAMVINLSVDPSTTIGSNMYTLSSNSVTIAAGETSGSVTLTTIADNMPIAETLDLVMNLTEGEHNATAGTQLKYKLLRIDFCPWAIEDMVGSYTGVSSIPYWGGFTMVGGYEITQVDATHIAISGLGKALYIGGWGETVTGGDQVVFEYKANGLLVTENQHLCETDGIWDYYFGPSDQDIKWDGCAQSFSIPWYFHWDDAYGDDVPFSDAFTKD